MTDLSKIKALTFDVGGTVFDWRGAIQKEVTRLAAEQEADVDVTQFATDWRRWMFATLARVRSGNSHGGTPTRFTAASWTTFSRSILP